MATRGQAKEGCIRLTVKELTEKLRDYPEDAPVFLYHDRYRVSEILETELEVGEVFIIGSRLKE